MEISIWTDELDERVRGNIRFDSTFLFDYSCIIIIIMVGWDLLTQSGNMAKDCSPTDARPVCEETVALFVHGDY